jgi:hypothetical protein
VFSCHSILIFTLATHCVLGSAFFFDVCKCVFAPQKPIACHLLVSHLFPAPRVYATPFLGPFSDRFVFLITPVFNEGVEYFVSSGDYGSTGALPPIETVNTQKRSETEGNLKRRPRPENSCCQPTKKKNFLA